MTVYLGDHGFVQLKRTSAREIRGVVQRSDVSVSYRRFSIEKHDVRGELITGDQVDVTNIDFIVGRTQSDWRGFVYVDIMGGIRLYETFAAAVRGNIHEALELKTPAAAKTITIRTRDNRYEQLAQIRSFEFTSERETIDTTVLTDDFRKRYEAGLISGQGRLDCFWDHKHELCDPSGCSGAELPVYLAQLCIRLVQGADFDGRFFIYTPGNDDPRGSSQAVWYEAECIVTNVSVNVSATEVIETSIDFVTTGQIKLLIGNPASYLLTEAPARILLEQNNGGGSLLMSPLDAN